MLIRGIEFQLHENEDLSNHIRRELDFFEREILEYISFYHSTHKTILDIGANIGNHSIYFANFLTYETIICIEPVPENYELLKINMAPYKNIGLVNAAASATTHENLAMSINRSNMGASEVHLEGELKVKAISIDKMALHGVTLMKIDVEGHEPAVISGAVDTIYRSHPLILIEDWGRKYDVLLAQFDYELEKGWPEHQTFLYRWKYA